MKALSLALGSAVLLVLAQAPFCAWPLAFVALLPLAVLALRQGPVRGHLLAAYAGGVVLFGGGCWWLAVITPVNLALMVVAEALALPMFVVIVRVLSHGGRGPFWIVLPVAWVAVEFTRSHVPFNGFPWLLLGYALHRPLELAQAADLCGVTGLSLVVALVNGLLLDAWRARAERRRRRTCLGAALALPLLLYGYGHVRQVQVLELERPGPRVAIVQANVPQGLKQRLESVDDLWRYQLETTARCLEQAGESGFDLLCWAETMFPGPLGNGFDPISRQADEQEVAARVVRPLLKPLGAAFLTGSSTVRPVKGSGERYNSALLFDARGRRTATYHKTVLVPGGEFVPLRWVAPDLVDDLVRSITGGFLPNLTPGSGPAPIVLETRAGQEFRFAATICYENCYPGYGARAAARGVDFIINLSNEAWFGDSTEFDQMDVATRFRAIEARRTIVRVTNSGISAVYDAAGRRVHTLTGPRGQDRAVAGALVADIPVFRGFSVFRLTGELLGCVVVAIAAGWFLAAAWPRLSSYFSRRST